MVGPGDAVVVEGVVDRVVWCYIEGNAVGGFGEGEGEAAAGGGGIDGVKVKVGMAVEVVDVDAAVAIELGDFVVGVRVEEVLEGFIEGV